MYPYADAMLDLVLDIRTNNPIWLSVSSIAKPSNRLLLIGCKMAQELYLQLAEQPKVNFASYLEETEEQSLITIGPIQKLNIFVGSTNAGKSRLIRGIMNNEHFTLFNNKTMPALFHSISVKLKNVMQDISDGKLSILNLKLGNPGWHEYPVQIKESKAFEFMGITQIEQRRTIELDREFFNNAQKAVAALLIKGKEALDIPIQSASGQRSVEETLKYTLAGIGLVSIHFEVPVFRHVIHINELNHETPSGVNYKIQMDQLREDLTKFFEFAKGSWNSVTQKQCKRIYIPVLRTAVPLVDPVSGSYYRDDLFSANARKNYSIDASVDIFTGLELYQTIFVNRADELSVRQRLETFCNFLSQTFFDGQPVELVSIHESLKKGQRINFRVNHIERPLHELGDGIQALIIIMYKIFMADPESWIFIEEPEVSLHPGLQRIVVDTILNHKVLQSKNLIVFMTSHSNHLLDISIPNYPLVSVFSLERIITDKEKFVVRSVSNKRLHALTSLGAANSSVLMANCSVWVEGITDRKYIRSYLKAYWASSEYKNARRFQEDIHFAFFEYAGSNLEHYIFAADADLTDNLDEAIKGQFIANRVFLVADQDNGKTLKHTKWKGQTYAHFVYFVTPGKEIENMISHKILAILLKSGFSKYIKADSVDSSGISYAGYQNVGLGEYLAEKFKVTDGIKEASGTLNSYYKMKLADSVSDLINGLLTDDSKASTAWELLSDEAKSLTRDINIFISSHNIGVAVG